MYRKFGSHWTERGALVAYNQLVEALGKPDWRTPPESLSWTRVEAADGDLTRMAGRPPETEPLEIHNRRSLTPPAVETPLAGVRANTRAPVDIRTGHPGPTVLLIGDSFTADFFPPLLAPFAGRIVWVHHELCEFDWRVIDLVKPDAVMLAPAERGALCRGRRPLDF